MEAEQTKVEVIPGETTVSFECSKCSLTWDCNEPKHPLQAKAYWKKIQKEGMPNCPNCFRSKNVGLMFQRGTTQ